MMALPQNIKGNQIFINSGDDLSTNRVMEMSKTEELLRSMVENPDLLKQGYKVFSSFETHQNFYLNFLKMIFESNSNDVVKKLASSSLKIFLKKNWCDENYILVDEKMVQLLYNYIGNHFNTIK